MFDPVEMRRKREALSMRRQQASCAMERGRRHHRHLPSLYRKADYIRSGGILHPIRQIDVGRHCCYTDTAFAIGHVRSWPGEYLCAPFPPDRDRRSHCREPGRQWFSAQHSI